MIIAAGNRAEVVKAKKAEDKPKKATKKEPRDSKESK